jgi:hypothetical protein
MTTLGSQICVERLQHRNLVELSGGDVNGIFRPYAMIPDKLLSALRNLAGNDLRSGFCSKSVYRAYGEDGSVANCSFAKSKST